MTASACAAVRPVSFVLGIALAFLLLGTAGTSQASTISGDANGITYQAAASEVNKVVVSMPSGIQIQVKDTGGAQITDNSPVCTVNTNKDIATCNVGSATRVIANLEDMNDTFKTTALNQINLFGGPGNDNPLIGGKGADLIVGGDGDDLIKGDDAVDVLFGQNGSDKLFGGADSDYLIDNGTSASEDDVLDGDSGDDSMIGGIGADDLKGGGNIDTAIYSERTSGVTISLDGLPNDGNSSDASGDRSDNVDAKTENVLTGSGFDRVSPRQNQPNRIVTGAGSDWVDYQNNSTTGVYVNPNDGLANDGPGGGADGDEIDPSVENMNGTVFADRLEASATAFANCGCVPLLWGLQGADTIIGHDGPDSIDGGPGNDVLLDGRGGVDRVDGGGDSDADIRGGEGSDSLSGDGGTIVAAPGNDTLAGGPGNDFYFSGGSPNGMDTYWDERFGGDGDDYFDAFDSGSAGGLDTLRCGTGTDSGKVDFLDVDDDDTCEFF